MVEMERLLGMAEFNVEQMAMLLGDFQGNNTGSTVGGYWRWAPVHLWLEGPNFVSN